MFGLLILRTGGVHHVSILQQRLCCCRSDLSIHLNLKNTSYLSRSYYQNAKKDCRNVFQSYKCKRYLSTTQKTVRIGCASGFWGDTATSVPQLVFGGKLDFLVFDYLSEITMSLLTASKAKFPNQGYAPDFVHTAIAPFIKDIHKKGIRVVSNAGGVNPHACAAALQEVVQKADLNMKIAVITGDDLMAEVQTPVDVKETKV